MEHEVDMYRGSEKDKKRMREYAREYRKTPQYKKYIKDYQLTIKPEVRKYNYMNTTIRNHVIRLLVLLAYCGKNGIICYCCGENNNKFMTIDHINGGGNIHRKETGQGAAFYRWLYKRNFPPGYRVACFNCNCGASKNGGICPHKTFLSSKTKINYVC